VVTPEFYRTTIVNKKQLTRWIVYVLILTSFGLMVLSMFDDFPDDPVYYCTSRSLGLNLFNYKVISYVAWTGTTALIYVSILISLRCVPNTGAGNSDETLAVNAAGHQQHQNQSNLAEIRQKVNRKVTKVIAWTLLAYCTVQPVHSVFSLIFKVRFQVLVFLLGFSLN